MTTLSHTRRPSNTTAISRTAPDPRSVVVAIDRAGGIDAVAAKQPDEAAANRVRARYASALAAIRQTRPKAIPDAPHGAILHGHPSIADSVTSKAAPKPKVTPTQVKSPKGRLTGPRPCAEPSCVDIITVGMWCDDHNPLPDSDSLPGTHCAAPDCDADRTDRVWCKKHNTAMYEYGSVLGAKDKQTCVITGCSNKWFRSGVCKDHKADHQERWAAFIAGEQEDTSECLDPTCDRPVDAHGYCPPHGRRITRFGHPNGKDAKNPAPKSLKSIRLSAKPLADIVEANGSLRGSIKPGLSDKDYAAFECRIRRAIGRGYLTMDAADEIAVKALRTLPEHIWGDEWWNPEGGDVYWPQDAQQAPEADSNWMDLLDGNDKVF